MDGYSCLISDGDRVFLVKKENLWALPRIERRDGWAVENARIVIEDVKDQFNMQVIVLRHLQDAGHNPIYELENHSTDWVLPPNGRWIANWELTDLELEILEQREILEGWFAEVADGPVSELRSAWQKKGWFLEAAKWIEKQLGLANYKVTGPIEQVKGGWGWSSLFCIGTSKGEVYFKADFAKPPSEPLVVHALAKQWSQNVPALIALDREQRWMLMKGFDDRGWENTSLERQADVMRLFAQIQQGCASQMDVWVALGCADLRLDALQKDMDRLFDDRDALLLGQANGLTETEQTQLKGLAPKLKKFCVQLSAYDLPDTLMHQDFRPGNVAVGEKHDVFYDWSDAVLSHPFFSVTRFLNKIRPPDGVDLQDPTLGHKDDYQRRALRDAYLEPWCIQDSLEHLIEAFTLARQLHLVYMPIKWYLDLPYLEPHSPWHQTLTQSVPLLLKILLKRKSYFDGKNQATI